MTETPQQAARRLAAGEIAKGFAPVGLHEYRDTDGAPLFWRIRCKHPDTGEKWIRPMHLNGNGYKLGEPATQGKKPLYRLPELLAADPAALVWIVEGETCADALARLGVTVTTSGSASSADAADWEPLQGRCAVLWPDNDKPGAGYADAVAERLRALGCVVELVDVDGLRLPAHGDCVDWLREHPQATAADVLELPRIAAPGEPEPLIVPTLPEPYPLDALPATIRAAVAEVQGFVQAPVALVASSALAALSVAGQSLAGVKRADKLTGPCSLFMLALGDSGERKTTCDGFFTAAIREHDNDQAEAAKPELKKYRVEMNAWASKQNGVMDALRAAAKSGKPTLELESKLAELEASKPEEPIVPKLLRGDETPEHLAWTLAKHWPAAGVVSSEAGVIFGAHGMGKDSVMRNLGLLNVLWDGGTLSIGRKTSESFDVQGARLTLGLQIQEATLRAFHEQSGALARGSGFMARFLISWPESTQGKRPFKEAPTNWPGLTAFSHRLRALLKAPQPLDDNGRLEPPLLGFTPEAKRAWVAFHDAIEGELGTGGELADVRDVASKTADNAARLAALFHLFAGDAGAISAESFAGAARIAAWHLNESRRFFGELAMPPEVSDAMRLERWLLNYCQAHKVQAIKRRELQQAGPLRNGDRLTAALRTLADLHRLFERTEGRSKLIEPHPSLLRGVEP